MPPGPYDSGVFRTVRFWVFLVLWSAVVLVPLLVVSLLTGGLLKRVIVGWAAPLWARPVLWVGGVRLRFVGRDALTSRVPRVVVLNHASSLDLFAGASLGMPAAAPVGKIELWRTPLVGQVFALLGMVFVDRGDHDHAMRTLARLKEKILHKRLTVVFAPEGTRSRSGELGRFKLGAFVLAQQVGVPVVPVVLHNTWNLMHPGEWTLRPGEVVIDVKPPRPIDGEPRAFADALRDDYARWLAEGPP